MDDAILAQEHEYWVSEEHSRAADLKASRERGDPPHVSAAAQLRWREAAERLAAL